MNRSGARITGWLALAAGLMATPVAWWWMRGRAGDAAVPMPADAGDAIAIAIVSGASVGAFLLLIALMMFMLARRLDGRARTGGTR